MRVHLRRTFTLAAMICLAGCLADTPGPQPLQLTIRADAPEFADVPDWLTADLEALDHSERLTIDNDGDLILTLRYDPAVTTDGYRISGGGTGAEIAASTLLGAQYGLYHAIEVAGLHMIHPERAVFPERFCLDCVAALDVDQAPVFWRRGTHIHTMHPIEYESTLLGSDPGTLPRFDRLLAWLIARRQEYLEWNLLRTVPADWLEHASSMVERAHTRGFKIGIVAPLAFRQQNSYFLMDAESDVEPEQQIRDNLDWLMQANWDAINLEMGASEFFSISDIDQLNWLNLVGDHLDERWAGTRTATKVHVSSDQFAENFDNINFNFLPQFADANVGVMPHTVQFYDLYRAAPTYGNDDFSDMRNFLLAEIGKRDVFYYPETAYWITFDNDVPLFLPEYAHARWNDLHQLKESGMDGQINFSSGFEWGYWLGDYVAAWHAYAPGDPFRAPLDHIFAMFGEAAPAMVDWLLDYISWQGRELLENNGQRWIVGWDAADEVGYFVDIHTQPIRVRLHEVDVMPAAELDAFASGELSQLTAMARYSETAVSAWQDFAARFPADAQGIYDEIDLGLQINDLRARYVLALYEAVIARQRHRLDPGADATAEAAHFNDAEALLAQALAVVAQQEALYRFPYAEISAERESRTSYPFGYLFTVSDLFYWQRELTLAKDPDNYDFLFALYDLAEAGGF